MEPLPISKKYRLPVKFKFDPVDPVKPSMRMTIPSHAFADYRQHIETISTEDISKSNRSTYVTQRGESTTLF